MNLSCRNPLDQSSPWVGKDAETDEEVSIEAGVIQDDMARIGAELAMLQISRIMPRTCREADQHLVFSEGTVDEYEAFLEKYSLILHPNHFHMVTAKHSLCQMLGRTEGFLIQDMPLEKVLSITCIRLLD